MQRQITFLVFLSVLSVIVFESFTWNQQGAAQKAPASTCVQEKISKPNGKTSHFFGLNCMSCHREGRKGKSCFSVAGSVLDEDRSKIHKNPIVKLYTEPGAQGKLVATLYGDANGNFYTTADIDFGRGLYPTLIGNPTASEPIKHMRRPIFNGQGSCNQCHGYNEEALGID